MPTTEIWRALYGAAVLHRAAGKYVIAINDDIDPDNADALLWAMSYRANAEPRHAHPAAPRPGPRAAQQAQRRRGRLGADRRDAQGGLPADLAAQARIHGDARKTIWEELGLPKLKPEAPWFGYSLGEWSDELDEAALRARRAAIISRPARSWSKRRRKDVRMNTEVRNVKE